MFGKRKLPVLFHNGNALAKLLIGNRCGVIKTRGTPEAVRNRTTSRGPQNHKNRVGSYETIIRWAKQNYFFLLRIVSNGVSGASFTFSLPNFS